MASTRNSLEIRAELLRRGLSVSDVARRAGVSRPLASRTVKGLVNNRKVLRALIAVGVSRRLLDLPDDLKGREAA